MELRVWVDGTQRVVCGVKLTTTCQEIVFALAHATQQAGRFTMIERWRNNERLLSPNEQPLVTLQRWGDRMNEVEFILRKTSTDPQLQPVTATQPANNHPITHQLPNHNNNNNNANGTHNTSNGNNNAYQTQHPTLNHFSSLQQSRQTPQLGQQQQQKQQQSIFDYRSSLDDNLQHANSQASLTNNSSYHDMCQNHIHHHQYHHQHHPLNQRPQTVLGLASHNGYNTSETNITDAVAAAAAAAATNKLPPTSANSQAGLDPFKDLYSTINKKRKDLPPAVPAKPRVINPAQVGPVNIISMSQANNMTMKPPQPTNVLHHPQAIRSPLQMYPNRIMRPRNPPGYLDYLEAMASRNSLPQNFMTNPAPITRHQHSQSNIYPTRTTTQAANLHDNQQVYSNHNNTQNGASPVNQLGPSAALTNNYRYSISGLSDARLLLEPTINSNNDTKPQNLSQALQHQPQPLQNNNHLHNELSEPNLIINRGSAINIKIPSNSHNNSLNNSHRSTVSNDCQYQNSIRDNSSAENGSTVSQMGHDMLRLIEKQKKVLINQKNELDRLDNDKEYWEAKQNSEQAELISRIEEEICQLEKLWKENQAQIQKLEDQDFEKELEKLKAEQLRMESELEKQKSKLACCEDDIAMCNSKIQQLEIEVKKSALKEEDEPNNTSVTVGMDEDTSSPH